MSKQYIGNISSTVAGTNFTFNTNLDIGEESSTRKILVFFALRTGTAESIANKVLLNDIEADIIYNKIDEQGNLHIVAYATIPGTTLNASVNLGTSYLRCIMHVYRLDNLDFLECASIMNKTSNKTTININTKPNGAILGMAVVQYSNASVNTKFSELIKDSALDIPYVSTMVGSIDTNEDANVEVSATFSRTSDPKTLICISFKEKNKEIFQFGKILKDNLEYNTILKNNNELTKVMLDNVLYWKKGNINSEVPTINYIEYLENVTNNDYIDTGFQPNQDTTLIVELMPNTTTQYSAIAGARSSLVSYCLFNNLGTYRADYNNKNVASKINLDISKKVTLKLDKNNFYVNNELINEFTYVDFTTEYDLYLFNVNNRGNTMTSIKYKLYSAKVYDNDELIRDFKPCKDKNDISCLYEAIENKYYYLDGTNTNA